jgi:6-phosphogluconolactonase
VKASVEVHPDHDSASRSCAHRIVDAARKSISLRRGFSLALTGGNTPADCYRILAKEFAQAVDWTCVDFLVGDERMVALEDPRSNFGTAQRLWLNALGLPRERLHPMPVELDDDSAARSFERELRALAPTGLDLVLMGLGDDGHTASLFPGRLDALPPARWVVSARAPASSPVERRLTLTFSALQHATEVLFLVTGANKARVLAQVLAGQSDLPAARVSARQSLHFILDEAAAALWRRQNPRAAS